MNTDKQAVEEMADNICEIQNKGMKCAVCDTGCDCRMFAEALYNAGYRRQSENTVEVVRCKDCKCSRPMIFDGYYFCKRNRVVRKAEDFCSRGAKMKGGAE